MKNLVAVSDFRTGQTSYALADRAYQVDELVVLNTEKGDYLARVSQVQPEFHEQDLPTNLPSVSLADERDSQAFKENQSYAKDSEVAVRALIAQNGLSMELLDISFPLDRSLVFIRFKAEGRVDFRQLVRDLAGHFRCRVELHQVGERELAKIYGGLGPCGRALCCSSFLGEFPPVSIKMLKNQGLSLKSDKHTGLCGRLMCCLSFEDDFYSQAKESFPDLGAEITTQQGPGQVVGLDIFNNSLEIRLTKQNTVLTYDIEEVTVYG